MDINSLINNGAIDDNIVNSVTNIRIDHKDLVQISGYFEYQYPKEEVEIKINGKRYEVIDTKYGESSGLDAFVIKDINDKNEENLIIVFVGSDQLIEDWLLTNTKLPSDLAPEQIAQIEAAQEYARYVNDKLGNVSYVTGNSLGGALAHAVAIDNSDITSVTLNPAPLPDGMVDPNEEYPTPHQLSFTVN